MTAPQDVKKIVLLVAIGLCEAIQRKAISIDEAAHYLFSPHTMKLMSGDPKVKEIILMATEFDDLSRLVPTALADAVADVENRSLTALKQMPSCDFQKEPWLDHLLSK